MDKKRLDYLDMVKGIGIILVVIGHSTVASDSVVTWLASFHMPLFFIVSGMLIQYLQEEQREFRTLIIRKARSIMLPYVTFSVIILLIKLYYVIATPELMPTRDFQIAIVDTFSLEGISVMWFLPALFIGEMFFFLLLKILKSKKHYVIPIVALLFAVIPVLIKPTLNQWSAQYTSLGAIFLLGFLAMLLRAFVVVAFLTMGYYIQKVAEKIEVKKIVGVIVGVIAILVTPILAFWNGRVDLHFLVFQNIVLYYVTACIGTLGIIMICKNIKVRKSLTYLGENSLIIMATHMDCLVLMVSLRVSYKINQYIPFAKEYVLWITLAACITIIELIIIYLFNRYFYLLIGKKRKTLVN